jgi:CheY-like chemotaxis protein
VGKANAYLGNRRRSFSPRYNSRGVAAAGYAVVEARDGAEGLRLNRVELADLIITDLFMPEKDGIAVVIELKQAMPDIKSSQFQMEASIATSVLCEQRNFSGQHSYLKSRAPRNSSSNLWERLFE